MDFSKYVGTFPEGGPWNRGPKVELFGTRFKSTIGVITLKQKLKFGIPFKCTELGSDSKQES
jgi:hypothetical protein